MRVLGIDPGSRRAGWGVVEGKGSRSSAVACGVVSPPVSETLPIRLHYLFQQFTSLIAEHRPDHVAVENVFFARNAKSALTLGQARAAAIIPAVNAGLPVHEYSALEIKKAATGKGKADKDFVAEMVCRILGLKERPTPADATDALAIALCHLHSAPVIGKAAAR